MVEPILVANSNEEECRELCVILQRNHYSVVALDSVARLESFLHDRNQIVILDLDTFPVSNQLIRSLRRKNPQLCIIALSSRTFHPELQEAMSSHISACLVRPLDAEELVYWVKSVCKQENPEHDRSKETQITAKLR